MPIWTFRCKECGNIKEVIQLSRNDSKAARPPQCSECEMYASFELVVTPLGRMHFKGPGFHVNDYRKPRPIDTKTTHALGAPRETNDK